MTIEPVMIALGLSSIACVQNPCRSAYSEMKRRRFVVHGSQQRSTAVSEEAAKSLAISYTDDYDILSLDLSVRQLIGDHTAKSVRELEEKLAVVEQKIENCCVVMELRELCTSRINLTSKLADMRASSILNHYVSAATPLLISYRDTPLGDRVIDAIDTAHQSASPSDLFRERVVNLYMNLIEELHLPTLSVTREKVKIKDKTPTCSACNAPLSGCTILLSGYLICSVCGSSNKPKSSSSSAKGYDALSNLLKTFKRYICIVTPKCNIDEVMSKLDEYFISVGDKDGAYYRDLECDERGRKEGTSIDGLCLALKMLGCDDLYRHYMYVGHHYYGWKVPDLKHLEEVIVRNFRIKQDVWDNEMSEIEKGCQSNICTEYRLCRECQHAGYECDLYDFKVSRKRKTIERYDNGYSIMCKRSGFGGVFELG